MYVCMYVGMFVCMYYVCTHVFVYVCICIYMYEHMYICMYVLYIYIMYVCKCVCCCCEMKYVLRSCSSCPCDSRFLQNTSTLNTAFVQFSAQTKAHHTALLHTLQHYCTHYNTTISVPHVLSHNYLTLSIYPPITSTYSLQTSWLHRASNNIETFYYQLMHIMLKNTELLKHSKITLQHVSVYVETFFRELQSVLG